MNWIATAQARPAKGAETLILTRDGRVYASRFEARAVQDNNRVPYGWTGPGPFSFFGHDVLYWMPVPAKPEGVQ